MSNNLNDVKPKVTAIILAAGAARRFGRPKQLERWPASNGPTLVERTLDNALACGADSIIVVTGNAAEEVAAKVVGWAISTFSPEIAAQKCRPIYNTRWAEGQGFSVAVGIKALEPETAGVIIFLADQPRLAPTTGTALLEAFSQSTDPAAIVFPVFEGKRGNPVVFGRAHFAALAALEGDVGGRAVVKAYPQAVREVVVIDPAIHEDVDTPQDLANLTKDVE